MKALSYFMTLCLAFMVSCSCNKTPEQPDIPTKEETVKLMVQGEPFLMVGAQLRTDYLLQLDGLSYDDLERYFELAAKTNILLVSVPIAWRDIEKQYGVYDMSLVYKYIEYCEKYKMKLELLWYGSYMCGYTVEGYVPDYVVKDSNTYPELNPSAAYQGWLGKQYYLVPNTPELVEREAAAISEMMKAIYEYDKSHGERHTVIGVQIENEPDMLATRHNAETGFSPAQIWPDLIQMLDTLGQAVKDSDYECYTRVNQTTTYADFNGKAAEIAATEGIDHVGVDPYENNLYNIELKLRWLKKIPGNYSHIAENGGEYANNDVLMLKALSMGCGYQVFEVVTTPHEFLKDWTLRGLYNPDFSFKSHTQRMIDAFGIFRDGWVDLACASPEDIIGFNLKTDGGRYETSESGVIGDAYISWSTTDRGIAYAVGYDGHLTLASTKADMMTFNNNLKIKSVEKGHYDIDRKWNVDAQATLSGNTLVMEPCTVYRIYLD